MSTAAQVLLHRWPEAFDVGCYSAMKVSPCRRLAAAVSTSRKLILLSFGSHGTGSVVTGFELEDVKQFEWARISTEEWVPPSDEMSFDSIALIMLTSKSSLCLLRFSFPRRQREGAAVLQASVKSAQLDYDACVAHFLLADFKMATRASTDPKTVSITRHDIHLKNLKKILGSYEHDLPFSQLTKVLVDPLSNSVVLALDSSHVVVGEITPLGFQLRCRFTIRRAAAQPGLDDRAAQAAAPIESIAVANGYLFGLNRAGRVHIWTLQGEEWHAIDIATKFAGDKNGRVTLLDIHVSTDATWLCATEKFGSVAMVDLNSYFRLLRETPIRQECENLTLYNHRAGFGGQSASWERDESIGQNGIGNEAEETISYSQESWKIHALDWHEQPQRNARDSPPPTPWMLAPPQQSNHTSGFAAISTKTPGDAHRKISMLSELDREPLSPAMGGDASPESQRESMLGGDLVEAFERLDDDNAGSPYVDYCFQYQSSDDCMHIVKASELFKTAEGSDIVIEHVSITPTTLVVQGVDRGRRHMAMYDSRKRSLRPVEASGPLLALFAADRSWFALQNEGLVVFVRELTIDSIITNTIKCDRASVADTLCRLNGWDPGSVFSRALLLGLDNGYIDLVERALDGLAKHDDLMACDLIMKHVPGKYKSGGLSDRGFFNKLLRVSISFLVRVINNKVRSFDSGADGPDALTSGTGMTVVRLSNDLESLRRLQFMAYNESLQHFSALDSGLLNYVNPQSDGEGDAGAADGVNAIDTGAPASAARYTASSLFHELFTNSRPGSVRRAAEPIRVINTSLSTPAAEDHECELIRKVKQSSKDSMESELLLSFERSRYERWERMPEEFIVKEALMCGVISLAISYLCDRRKRRGDKVDSLENRRQIRDFGFSFLLPEVSLEQFKVTGFRMIYHLLCNNQLNFLSIGSRILRNIGESDALFFKDVAFYTSRRLVRNRLTSFLRSIGFLNQEDIAVVNFLEKLEGLYPNPCFTAEYNRRWTKFLLSPSQQSSAMMAEFHGVRTPRQSKVTHRSSEQKNRGDSSDEDSDKDDQREMDDFLFVCGDIDDLRSEVETGDNFRNDQNNVDGLADFVTKTDDNEDDIESAKVANEMFPPAEGKVLLKPRMGGLTHSGYLHATLHWTKSWDKYSSERVLIEKLGIKIDASFTAKLLYVVDHNLWHDIPDLVATIDTSSYGQHVAGKGDALVGLSRQASHDLGETDAAEALETIYDVLNRASSFIQEALVTELGKRGLFLSSEFDNFPQLLQHLASSGQLFPKQIAPMPDVAAFLTHTEWSAFHRYVLHHCFQQNVPSVLYAYVDAYDLGADVLDSDGAADALQSPWVMLLFLLRDGNRLFEASLANANMSFGTGGRSGKGANVDMMMRESRSLMALGTMMYMPITIEKALAEPADSPLKMDPVLLCRLLRPYRTLLKAILPDMADVGSCVDEGEGGDGETPMADSNEVHRNRWRGDMFTERGDISLYEMLDSVLPFDMEEVFGLRRDATEPASDPGCDFDMQLFSGKKVSHFAEVEKLDMEYYLSTCRPLQAFHCLLGEREAGGQFRSSREVRSLDIPQSHKRVLERLNLRQSELKEIQRATSLLAIRNFLSDDIVSSVTCFQELCDIDAEELCVNVGAAKRIYSHEVSSDSLQQPEEVFQEIVALFEFFSVDGKGGIQGQDLSALLMNALSRLEAATRAMPSSKDRLENPLSAWSPESPWHLVALFCRTHKLPQSFSQLHEHAQRNDWVKFLSEAQFERCPPKQLLEIIGSHFSNEVLREHLKVTIRKLLPDDWRSLETQGSCSEDVFEALLKNHDRPDPGKWLLRLAFVQKSPLLAVACPCFQEVSSLDCSVVWMYCVSDMEPSVLFSVTAAKVCSMFEDETAFRERLEATASRSFTPASSPQTTAKQSSFFSIADYSHMVAALCRSHRFETVVECCNLFHPSSPIINFVEFSRAFVQRRYDHAESVLRVFVDSVKKVPSRLEDAEDDGTAEGPGGGDGGGVEWLVSLSEDLLRGMLSRCANGFEFSKLLEILVGAGCGARYVKMLFTFQLSTRTGLQVDIETDRKTVLNLLMEKGLFGEARDYAHEFGESVDQVTLQEVRALKNEYQRKGLWDIVSERELFWQKCHSLLQEHSCSAGCAGDFFMGQTESLKEILTVKETIQLHQLAHQWLSGAVTKDGRPVRGPEALEEIEDQVWLLTAQSNTQVLLPDVSSISFQGLSSTVPEDVVESLGILIGELLNQGRTGLAKRLSSQFNSIGSRDVEIVETALQLVRRTETFPRISDDIVSLLRARGITADLRSLNRLELLEALEECCDRAGAICKKIRVNYEVSIVLSLTYEGLVDKDAYGVIHQLISLNKDKFPLCKQFIVHNALEKEKVAGVLASTFHDMLQARNEDTNSGGAFQEPLSHIWSRGETVEFVILSQDPKVLGQRVLDILSDEQLPHAVEAELFILAHTAFSVSGNARGEDCILTLVRREVEKYVRANEFGVLARLVLGLGAFEKLEYIFDLLIRYNEFELLLQSEIEDGLSKPLRLNLHRYLQTYHPHDTAKLTLVYRRFDMHRELGETLYGKAYDLFRALKDKQPSTEDIAEVMKLVIESSKCFLEAECYHLVERSNSMAALLALQASSHQENVIDLGPLEARNYMTYHADFHNALVVARMYQLNRVREWAGPVYQQAIINGNTTYFEHFRSTFSPLELFPQLINIYLSDPRQAANMRSFKKFLVTYLTDREYLLQICEKLEFTELAKEIAGEIDKQPN